MMVREVAVVLHSEQEAAQKMNLEVVLVGEEVLVQKMSDPVHGKDVVAVRKTSDELGEVVVLTTRVGEGAAD